MLKQVYFLILIFGFSFQAAISFGCGSGFIRAGYLDIGKSADIATNPEGARSTSNQLALVQGKGILKRYLGNSANSQVGQLLGCKLIVIG